MHGHDPVVAGDDIDRPANRRATIALWVLPWFHRLEDQVQVVYVLRQVGAGWVLRQALDQAGFETDRRPDRREVVGRPALQVDPQELALADVLVQTRRQPDLAVLAVRVIEADPRSADPLAARRDQWRTASSTATSAAMNAVAYWSTSIDRSTCWLIGGSIAPTWGIRVTV